MRFSSFLFHKGSVDFFWNNPLCCSLLMISFPQLSPYGPEDGRISPLSPQGSPCGSPASPTLASLQSSGGYYGSSPTGAGYMGMSPNTSPTATSHAGGFGLSQSYGEPPRKIFPEVAFEDLSASFKNLYKSVFDASQGGENFGKWCLKWNSLALTFFFLILSSTDSCYYWSIFFIYFTVPVVMFVVIDVLADL